MKVRQSAVHLSIPAMLVLAVACKGASGQASLTPQSACDDEFDALIGLACSSTTLPPAELARLRAIFGTICLDTLALPGSGATPAAIERCAAAVKLTGCVTADLPECTYQGSLSDGAPCNVPSQCQSGICGLPMTSMVDAGGAPPCGTCAAAVAVGQPCASNVTCAFGSVCAISGGGYACTLVSHGDVGATCDGVANVCKTGLYCDTQASHCTAPVGAGAPCAQAEGCSPPLLCAQASDGGGSLTCIVPASAGAPCQANEDCQPVLICSSETSLCTEVTWASPGQPCSDVALCLVGKCPLTGPAPGGADAATGTGATCPMVTADGQPCMPGGSSSTCDTLSICIDGSCQQPNSVTCQ